MDVVTLAGVTKSYGSHVAVDHLDLKIPEGAVYGFIGPNGAGKTTTIRMIMNILMPDSGQVAVFGGEVDQKAKDRIGYLPEERGMYRKMRVRDLVLFFARLKGKHKREVEQLIDDWLDRFSLHEWKAKKIEELSKGMGQKVQFISTIVHNPELVILDEPFSGLDPVNTEILTEIILELRRDGKTVIFSTHVMEQAEKLCDSIFMISKGEKVLDGSLQEIRERFGENILDVVGDGDFSAVEADGNVSAVRDLGGRAEILLSPGGDSQQVLRQLLDRVRVQSFRKRAPTLHDIFLRLAGHDATEEEES